MPPRAYWSWRPFGDHDPPADRASCGDVGGELQEVGCGRGLGAIVLPGGIAGDVAPLADGRDVEREDFRARLLVDLGDLDVVVLRALLAERLELGADGKDDVLVV